MAHSAMRSRLLRATDRASLWRPAAAARMRGSGEVSERLKEHAWKVCKRLNRASGVRIPLSPPDFVNP